LPDNVRLIVGWLNPRCFAMSVCVIMVLIFPNNFLYVKHFIINYNKISEVFGNIRKNTLAFLIKGGVLWF
jgi:hypothetical protein